MNQSTPTISHIEGFITFEDNFPETIEVVEVIAKGLVDHFGFKVVERVAHQFEPHGITFVYILSESHLVIHTWPEFNKIHIDLLTCRDLKKSDVEQYLKSTLNFTENIELR